MSVGQEPTAAWTDRQPHGWPVLPQLDVGSPVVGITGSLWRQLTQCQSLVGGCEEERGKG